jgi:hypothetical protein
MTVKAINTELQHIQIISKQQNKAVIIFVFNIKDQLLWRK